MSGTWKPVQNSYKENISKLNGLSQKEKNAFMNKINNTLNAEELNKVMANAKKTAANAEVRQQVETFVLNTVVKSRRPAKEVATVIALGLSHLVLLAATYSGNTNKAFGVTVYVPKPKNWLSVVRNYVGAVRGGERNAALIQQGRFLFEPSVGGYSRVSVLIMVEALTVLISLAAFQMSSDAQKDRAKEVLHELLKILKSIARYLGPGAFDFIADLMVAAMKLRRPDLPLTSRLFNMLMKRLRNSFFKNSVQGVINDMRRIAGDPTVYSPMRTGEKRTRQGNAIIAETPRGSKEIRRSGKVHRQNARTGEVSVRNSRGRTRTPPPTLPAPGWD